MYAAPPPPKPAAIVRAWSAALNRNDNAAAAAFFAHDARVVQGSLDVRLTTRHLALAFNAALPCAGKIVSMHVDGAVVTAIFKLGQRPKHICDGPGQKAAAQFIVENGKIVLWQRLALPSVPSSPTA
jgi:limonene-1,2-epoxide hydrolase